MNTTSNKIGKRGKTGMHGHHRRGPKVERVELKCTQCGVSFFRLASFLKQHPTTKYCSLKCMGIANTKESSKTKVICNTCGKEFFKRTDHLTKTNYCSIKCMGLSKRTPNAKWRDPAQIKKYMQSYSKKNREKINAKSRENNMKYRDKKAQNRMNRRSADKRGDFTAEQWKEMKEKYNHRCLKCNRKEPDVVLHADHIIPTSKGGITTYNNMQPLCSYCNISKGSKIKDYRNLKPETR